MMCANRMSSSGIGDSRWRASTVNINRISCSGVCASRVSSSRDRASMVSINRMSSSGEFTSTVSSIADRATMVSKSRVCSSTCIEAMTKIILSIYDHEVLYSKD